MKSDAERICELENEAEATRSQVRRVSREMTELKGRVDGHDEQFDALIRRLDAVCEEVTESKNVSYETR